MKTGSGGRAIAIARRQDDWAVRGARDVLRQYGLRMVSAGGSLLALAWLAQGQVASLDIAAVGQALRAASLPALAVALGLTLVSFLAMAAYDTVALRALGHDVPRGAALRAGFAATSIGQTLGFGLVVGAAVRWRFYRHNGLAARDCAAVTAVVTLGFFLALAVAAGACLLLAGETLAPRLGLTQAAGYSIGGALAALAAAVLVLAVWQPRLVLRGHTVALPRVRALVRMMVLAALDLLPAAAALWVLLPEGSAPAFASLVPVYLVALGLGLVSNVPGGLGVLELACLIAWPAMPQAELLAALILYRGVFYGVPFLVALALLADREWSGDAARPRADADPRPGPPVARPGHLPRAVARLMPVALRAEAGLAMQGDKRFALSRSGAAFVMYGERGNARVALSDPVGPVGAWPDLIAAFRADARRDMRVPVFYKASARFAATLRAQGLALHQIGEEAVVTPATFDPATPGLREVRRKAAQARKAGVTLHRHAAGAAPLARLAPVAAAWQIARGAAEQGFSMGRFEPRYLAHFPVLEARVAGHSVAFLSLWQSGDGGEWSLDLMRQTADAPAGTMHLLVTEAIGLAAAAGAARFSLCSVALRTPGGTLTERLASAVYHRRGAGLGLHGLYRFKDSFRPEWEPVFLAVPHGLPPLGAVLAVRSLVADPDR